MLSMQDFGLSLNDAGTLSFDSSKFEQKVKEDPDSTESFFQILLNTKTLITQER